jgi:hypothetical protein
LPTTMDFAYLSRGKLFIKRGDAPPELLQSQFGESVRQRAKEIQRRHAWKTEGRGAQFMGGAAAWGMQSRDPGEMPIAVNGLSPGCQEGQLLYTLNTPDISGIFVLREGDYFEQRIFHSADHRVAQVCAVPGQDQIAFVLRQRDGGASLAIMTAEGKEFTEITQGDSIDEFPHWVPGRPGTLVFQSAGIGRDARGIFAARGPCCVQQIDVTSGEMKCLAENEKFDFLAPQIASDGTLYYIRRPYEPPRAHASPWQMFLDIVLFPFRLVNALFEYLNFFSMTYSGKPLKTSGNARAKEMDMRRLMLMGNYVNALEIMKHSADQETPAMVPSNWELVRSASGGAGAAEVLAKGVLSFDLEEDGSVLYSNGSAIFRVDGSRKPALVLKSDLIEHVIAARLFAPPEQTVS